MLLGIDSLLHRAYASVDPAALEGIGDRVESFPGLVAGAIDAAWKTEAVTA